MILFAAFVIKQLAVTWTGNIAAHVSKLPLKTAAIMTKMHSMNFHRYLPIFLAWLFAATTSVSAQPSAVPETIDTGAEIKAAIPTHPREVLKYGKHFLVMDETGLLPADSNIGCGFYRDDTRYLKTWDLRLNEEPLSLLYANTADGYAGKFVYGNKASTKDAYKRIEEQSIMVERSLVITDALYEKNSITNFGTQPAAISFAITFGADFADMFEVRGQKRKQRGRMGPAGVAPGHLAVSRTYIGLDGALRENRLTFTELRPAELSTEGAVFNLTVSPKQTAVIETVFQTRFDNEELPTVTADMKYGKQKAIADAAYKTWRSQTASIQTNNSEFNELTERNFRDLYILRQPTPRGECVAAGIPWYAVAFGRDQAITAHETLPFIPSMSKDVLELLAAYQGKKTDDFTEERPGKIMHELRIGEMARLKEIPFIPYYGTVDATPLWLCLLSEFVASSGDLDFARRYWSNVSAALTYIDAEMAGGTYLRYGKPGAALSNQGWKDSSNSVMYSSGELAKQPIALSEVQGYLYQAWMNTAQLAALLGHKQDAQKLLAKAANLKTHFNNEFWMPKSNYLALALDGDGKQCDVISSNPGHDLSTGILPDAHANSVASIIATSKMFSGWGIRTLASSEKAYNPLSYHNGSVWPHDDAMIVEGLCKTKHKREADTICSAIFNVALNEPNYRLPELFCGLSKQFSNKPVWYPVSCSPQAWAAGSMFLMLNSLLGLQPDALHNTLHIVQPRLPSFLTNAQINGIHVGKATVDLNFHRSKTGTVCTVLRRSKGLKIVIQP
jgi:glycogen debranching enzyme